MKRLSLLIFFSTFTLIAQQNITIEGDLPSNVAETSGLIFYNNHLITHNDSGNLPLLIEIDTTDRSIARTVTVTNAANVDWEDLSQDDTYIYIADIGNFNGDRTNLRIYRVAKSDYINSTAVTAEIINFSYEDQSDFSGGSPSDWDAEAIIVLENEIIVFTKQWQSLRTVAYSLPKTPGDHQAIRLDGFDSEGLITGSTWNPATGIVFLIGYSPNLLPFVVRVENIQDDFSFSSSVTRISLPIGLAQVEAITHVSANVYFATSERLVNDSPPITLTQSLYRFETTDDILPDDDPIEPTAGGETSLVLFREFGSNLLQYELITDEDVFGRAIFDVHGRILQYTPAAEIQDNSIDISTFASSVYYLTIYLRNQILAEAFIAN